MLSSLELILWPERWRNFHFYIFFNVNVKNSEPPGFIMLHLLSQSDPLFENITQITAYLHPGWTSPSTASLHKTSPPRGQSHSSTHHWLRWTSGMQWLLVMSIGWESCPPNGRSKQQQQKNGSTAMNRFLFFFMIDYFKLISKINIWFVQNDLDLVSNVTFQVNSLLAWNLQKRPHVF